MIRLAEDEFYNSMPREIQGIVLHEKFANIMLDKDECVILGIERGHESCDDSICFEEDEISIEDQHNLVIITDEEFEAIKEEIVRVRKENAEKSYAAQSIARKKLYLALKAEFEA